MKFSKFFNFRIFYLEPSKGIEFRDRFRSIFDGSKTLQSRNVEILYA